MHPLIEIGFSEETFKALIKSSRSIEHISKHVSSIAKPSFGKRHSGTNLRFELFKAVNSCYLIGTSKTQSRINVSEYSKKFILF